MGTSLFGNKLGTMCWSACALWPASAKSDGLHDFEGVTEVTIKMAKISTGPTSIQVYPPHSTLSRLTGL